MNTIILDINHIDIDTRVREELTDIPALAESIQKNGLLQPIVVTQHGEGYRLVCGRRRLEAHFHLQKIDPAFSQIQAVIKEQLDPLQQRVVELEENLKRVDFNDLEKVKGVTEVHRIMQSRDPNWTMEQTATYLGYKAGSGWVSIMTRVADHVTSNPEGTAAKILQSTGAKGNILNAYKEVKREEVKRAQTMLDQLLSQKAAIQVAKGEDGVESRAAEILRLGDSLDLIKSIPTGSIHLTHTDPPYGIEFNILEKGDTKADMYKDDTIEDSTGLWRVLAPELYRVQGENSFAVVWCSFVQMQMIRDFMVAAGFKCANKPFIWVKPTGAAYAPTLWFASAYDSALVFAKGSPVLVKQGQPDWCNHPPLPPEQKTHPLERPVLMLADLMSRFLLPNQTVLDPFAGSGSTLVAALALKCNPIGFEKDQHFASIAKQNVLKALKR